MVFASTFRAADRGRAPRNLPVRAKVPFFARTQLFVSGGALVVARLSLAEGRLLQIRGSCITVAWKCEPHPCEAPQCAQRALNEGPVVGRTDLLFGRSCQLCSQCRCSPHFLGHFPLSFLVPLGLLLGSTIVVLHLHHRVSADREQFSTLHRAGADEKKSAPCTALAWMTTISPVGALPKPQPLLTNHLSTNTFTAFD